MKDWTYGAVTSALQSVFSSLCDKQEELSYLHVIF